MATKSKTTDTAASATPDATAAATPAAASGIVTVRVLAKCVRAGGIIAGKGAIIKLPEAEAKPLIEKGHVQDMNP